ncbi:MarR family transcriptional regulator [Streptomyces monticola]|uniref:MarR family transcriptional regulator n=1 Tax=Streptomyces monticola TaxID=2666263 RepID=A0ABW2JN81_9ACTN
MSDTNTVRSFRPVPPPEPLAGLTGAPAGIYTELVAAPGATAAELALAAGFGRSTATSALAVLEKQGLAIREPGGHEGARRTPDHWRPALMGQVTDASEAAVPDETEPGEPSVEGGDEADGQRKNKPTADEAAEDRAASAVPGDNQGPLGSASTAAEETVDPSSGKRPLAPEDLRQLVINHLNAHPGERFTADGIGRVIEKALGVIADAHGPSGDAAGPEVTDNAVRTVLEELTAEHRVVRDGMEGGEPCFRSTPVVPSGKKRRAPGQLRERVLEFLCERPGEEWGPTGISRRLEASSGAISNALDRLVKQGLVRQASVHPRRFVAISATEAKSVE